MKSDLEKRIGRLGDRILIKSSYTEALRHLFGDGNYTEWSAYEITCSFSNITCFLNSNITCFLNSQLFFMFFSLPRFPFLLLTSDKCLLTTDKRLLIRQDPGNTTCSVGPQRVLCSLAP